MERRDAQPSLGRAVVKEAVLEESSEHHVWYIIRPLVTVGTMRVSI